MHNLFKLELKDQVIQRSAYEIEGSFSVLKQIIPDSDNVPFYTETIKSKQNKNIVHFVLGKENSESGNYFNEASLRHIKKIIETETEIEKFNLLQRLNKYWEEKNKIYLKNFLDTNQIPLFKEQSSSSEKSKEPLKYAFQLETKEELVLKVPAFNVLGALKDLDIIYHVYQINNPKLEKIYFFELPGCEEKPEIVLKKINKQNEQILILTIKNYIDYPKNYKCVEGGLNTGTFS